MDHVPKIGSRVSSPGWESCGPYTGTVVAHWPTYVYDEERERETNIPLPESEWHVSVEVDEIPKPWPYPGNDKIAPQVANLTELACDHVWVEGVDENNQLIEPAFDVCSSCGEVRQ